MDRLNLLKTVYFDKPECIPVVFHINLSCWDYYPREDLAGLVGSHPALFPEGVPLFIRRGEPVPYPPWTIKDKIWRDPWGCSWKTSVSGYIGSVVSHPIAGLDELSKLTPPDPDKTTHWYPVEWKKIKKTMQGPIGFFSCLRSGEIGHGHTFLKLIDILGYEKTIYALHDDDPRLRILIGMLEEFNSGLAKRFMDFFDVELLGYAEDLGMQHGPMLSPELFRKHIIPSYQRIMRPAAEKGVIIHMHSDGDIRELSDDLLKMPICVLNIQDQVNGLEWIAKNLKGRIVIDLDIDRQHITPSGTPEKVQAYISEILNKLWDPSGGLILTFGLYPGTPLENVKALMDALEEVAEGRTG